METETRLPTVTCVVTVHNYGRFVGEAVRSVLDQDYPGELLDIVVVNDGSTDDTAEVLVDHFGVEPRVRVINQANMGFVGAMNTGLAAVTGDLVAILDGDDAWPAGRLRRQVELLRRRPQVGLVHGDMEIVDVEGHTLNPSFFAYSRFEVARGRVLGRLIHGPNFVAGGASVFRARFLEELLPIPEEAIYPDWYFATRIAQHSEIDHVDGVVNRYRMHGANMGLGNVGDRFFADMRNNVRIQRWMLLTLDTSSELLAPLVGAAKRMLHDAGLAAARLGQAPEEILPVSPAQRGRAARGLAHARRIVEQGEVEPAGRILLRALAEDPWNVEVASALGRVTELHRGASDLLAAGEQAYQDGDPDRAVQLLKFALEAGATGRVRAEIHNDLGVIAATSGRLREAETEFLNALRHEPELVDAVSNLTELRSHDGDGEGASVGGTRSRS